MHLLQLLGWSQTQQLTPANPRSHSTHDQFLEHCHCLLANLTNPPKPTQASGIGTSSATLYWSAPIGGCRADRYRISVAVAASSGGYGLGTPKMYTAYDTYYILTGLKGGTSYSVSVVAINAAGMSATGAATRFTTDSPACTQSPADPTNLQVSNLGTGSVSITWSAPRWGCDVDSYTLSYSVVASGGGVGFGMPQTVTTRDTHYVLQNLKSGTSYSISLVANNVFGQSYSGPTTTFSTGKPACNNPAATPTNLAVSGVSSTEAVLTWDAPFGGCPVDQYTVAVSVVASTPGLIGMGTPQKFTTKGGSYTLSNLKVGTSYAVSVIAVNSYGQSTAATSNFQTEQPACNDPPAAPSSLWAFNIDADSASLQWDAPMCGCGVDSYTISLSLLPSPGLMGLAAPQAFTTSATHYDLSGLKAGRSYSVAVTAKNAHGQSADASTRFDTVSAGCNSAPDAPISLQVRPDPC